VINAIHELEQIGFAMPTETLGDPPYTASFRGWKKRLMSRVTQRKPKHKLLPM
jgi:hypothetical protein